MKGPQATDDAPEFRPHGVVTCRRSAESSPLTEPAARSAASKGSSFERRCDMQRHNSGRARVPRTAVIICAAIIVTVGAAAAGWQMGQHPQSLPKASCGSATTHFLTRHTRLLGSDPGSLTCFLRAARVCRSASLHVTEMGVDAGTEYIFSIEPGGSSCRVTEWRQDYSANFGGSQSEVTAAPCLRTAVRPKAVLLTCSGRDVLIPAIANAPSPQSA